MTQVSCKSCWSLRAPHRPARGTGLVAGLLFLLAATSGCAITSRLDAVNDRLAALSQVADKADEMNRRLDEVNRRLAELRDKAESMDKKLATLEKVALRFAGPGTRTALPVPSPSVPQPVLAPTAPAAALPTASAGPVQPRPWTSAGLQCEPAFHVNGCDRRSAPRAEMTY